MPTIRSSFFYWFSWRLLGRFEVELDDLLLPYTFSLLHHSVRTDTEMAARIARVGLPFYRREETTAESA